MFRDEIIEELDDKKIIQRKNGYKFGEDTVLLARFFLKSLNKKVKVLDIGTGNAILPLLLYENKNIDEIVGVDIQEENINRSKRNLSLNNIENKITLECMDIREYKKSNYFDVVISNPPYMKLDGKLLNEDEHKYISRHEVNLDLESFFKNAKRFLKPIGKLCFVHRTFRLVEILTLLEKYNFNVSNIIFIYSDNKKSSIMYIEALKGKRKKLEVESYYIER